MKVIHNTEGFLRQHDGCVATIGKFDGVHLGHQRIVGQLLEKSAAYGVPSVVIVIEPHPEEFFASDPRDCPPRLSEAGEKVELLRALGVDYVYLLEFNRELSRLSPESYIDDVLVAGLNVRCLIVGNDFRFGYQRSGDFQLLRRFGEKSGFDVVETASCESAVPTFVSAWPTRTSFEWRKCLAARMRSRVPWCAASSWAVTLAFRPAIWH